LTRAFQKFKEEIPPKDEKQSSKVMKEQDTSGREEGHDSRKEEGSTL